MKKRIALTLFLVTLFILSAAISYFINIYKKVYVGNTVDTKASNITTTPTPTPDPLGTKNILILGYGGPGHEGAFLTDTIILAHIEPRKKLITLISIPRDIWVSIPIAKNRTEMDKINRAYSIPFETQKYKNVPSQYQGVAGAGNLSKNMVEQVTGMHVDNFISINFGGFKTIIDELGGIDVNVPFTFTDHFYPIEGKEDDTCGRTDEDVKALTATMSGDLLEQQFTCRYETLHFDKGLVHMDGTTALKFARSRHSDVNGSDFGRAIRQQAVIIAVKNKFLKYGSIPKLIPIINLVSSNVTTDIDITTGLQILRDQGISSDVDIKTISLNTDNVLRESTSSDGQYILLPKTGENDWASVANYIKVNIDKIDSESSTNGT